ncbi:MAG: hypothetical protein ABH858_07550, partial [Candidatus Omnitrophota bacterium]
MESHVHARGLFSIAIKVIILMREKRKDFWQVSVFSLLVIINFLFFSSFRAADPDLWGHVKFGEDIWRSKSIPRLDHYSYTADNMPWVNHEWAAEVFFYLIYSRLGPEGLVLFKTAVGLLLALVLWQTARIRARSLSLTGPVFLVISSSVIAFGFAIRPQIFTYLFFALFLYLLYLFRYTGKRHIFFIPLITVLWVNSHGGFLAGIGLLAIYTAAETLGRMSFFKQRFEQPLEFKKLKTLYAVFFLSLCATLFNPYRLGIWHFLSQTLSRGRPYIW